MGKALVYLQRLFYARNNASIFMFCNTEVKGIIEDKKIGSWF